MLGHRSTASNELLREIPFSRWQILPPGHVSAALLGAAPFGIAPAAVQQMMPPTMRAQASAIYLFLVNLIGLGLGPTAVASATQYIFKRDDSVHYSLALVSSISCATAAILLYCCRKPFLGSLDDLQRWHASQANTNS